jgi:predicted acyl esterase
MNTRTVRTWGVTSGLALALAAVWTPAPVAGQAAGVLARDTAVPMRDGVVLRADVWRPTGAGRFPTLVYRTPYGKTGTTEGAIVTKAVARATRWCADVRGRYASTAGSRPTSREGADGTTPSVSAAQPWSNGVGTFVVARAPCGLAASEPPHLVAMVLAMIYASPTHFCTRAAWDGWAVFDVAEHAPDLRRAHAARPPERAGGGAACPPTGWQHSPPAASDLPAFRGVRHWYYEWMRGRRSGNGPTGREARRVGRRAQREWLARRDGRPIGAV